MKADGRQADEAQHQGRAHAAFEPVERVGPELRRQLRNARIGEARDGRGSGRQHAFSRQIGLLDHLREHLGEDAGIGNRDGEDAGGRRQTRDLDQQQRPEQLVHRAQERAQEPDGAQPREHEREQKPGARADRDAEHGERHRPHHAHRLDGEEVRPDQAGHEAAHLGPRVERAHREVGQGERDGGDQQEQAGDGPIAELRQCEAPRRHGRPGHPP